MSAPGRVPSSGRPVRVDVLLSVHNGMPYLPEQLESLRRQTHAEWRLWVRDDASTDDTVARVLEASRADPRIHLLPPTGERLGLARSCGALLQHPGADADYLFLCDADDVWLPEKIERTLEVMRRAEAGEPAGTPVLVHTDLEVVDARLQRIHPSFWEYQGLHPEPATLRRLLFRNVVTGPTVLLNRRVVELAIPIPGAALYHDWWLALVAAAFGRVVGFAERTVLYRQHGRNLVGARPERGVRALTGKALSAWREPGRFRRALLRSADQAAAFGSQYGARLSPEDRAWVEKFAEISRCGPVRRKLLALELAGLPEHGVIRNLGRALRA